MNHPFQKIVMSFFLVTTALGLWAQEKEVKSLSLTVDQAVKYSREHSRAIRSAAIDVDSKADSRNHALNAFLPDIAFSGSIARPNVIDPSITKKADEYTAVGTASISLNWGLSIIQKVKKANLDYQNGLLSWEDTIKQNERDIKKLFYSLLLQQKTLETDQLSLENTFKRYENAEKSYASGNTTKINMLQNKVTYQNMKRDVEKEEIAFQRQIREFASVLGFSPDTDLILEGSLHSEACLVDKEKLLSAYSAYNSQLQSLQLQIDSLDAQMVGLNLDSWTPTLSFNYATKQTMYGLDNDWLDSDSWTDKGSTSISLAWNFTNVLPFSNNRIKYHDLERQKEKLLLQMEQTKDDILLDSQKLFDDLESSVVSLQSCKENIELAEESYALVNKAYNAGSADLVEVRDAEEQLTKSRLALQSELFTYVCALTDLEYMLDLPEDWQKR